jgi:LysR family cys regulon transcriptional activator
VLSAAYSDIVRSYVRENGCRIIASMALEDVDDGITRNRDVSHLFPWEITRIAYQNGKYLRHYEQKFIELLLDFVANPDTGKVHRI